jgi:hypothetical protein
MFGSPDRSPFGERQISPTPSLAKVPMRRQTAICLTAICLSVLITIGVSSTPLAAQNAWSGWQTIGGDPQAGCSVELRTKRDSQAEGGSCARGFEPVAGLISANAAREDSLLV